MANNQEQHDEKRNGPVQLAQKGRQAIESGRRAHNTLQNAQKTVKAAQAAIKTVQAAAAAFNPWVIGIIVAVILLLLIFMFFFNSDSMETDDFLLTTGATTPSTGGPGTGTTPAIPGFSFTFTGPDTIANGEEIEYTITIIYDPAVATTPLENIDLYNELPSDVEFVSTTGKVVDPNAKQLTWKLKEPENKIGFKLTLRPKGSDVVIVNTMKAIKSGSAYTNDDCGGGYADLRDNPIGANFGDPQCDFTKDELYTILQSTDPQYADKWFYEIVPCESRYYPNAWNGAAVDSAGAWGLYQMGRGKNGEFDHGDVEWRKQTSNAIMYNRLLIEIGLTFKYWQCST